MVQTQTIIIIRRIKALLLLALMLTMRLVAKADNDRVITYEQLPQPAKEMIKAHFASKVPMIITADFDDFEVFFESGEKIEFDIQGSWKEISCKRTFVPDALIPDMVKAGVKKSFPEATIIKIERDRRGYEVRLNNGFEVEFDTDFNVIDIDD